MSFAVADGQRCPDCNKTRARMFASMTHRLDQVYEAPADASGMPERYLTRSAAYQAGRQYTVLELKAIIKKLEADT